MKKTTKRAIIAIIIINLVLVSIAFIGKILGRFDYEDHLDDVVITVDDKGITLREFGYYIYEVEAFVQNQALLYDPENPKQWWNTHFSAGLDSQFVCDYAKKVATYSCISEEIYYEKAMAMGLVLTSSEEEQAVTEALTMFGGMNKEQLKITGLDESLIITLRKKHALASKYALYLMETQSLAGYTGDPAQLVNWDGAYYQQEILPEHEVQMNDKVMDEIVLGKITVNYKD